MKDGTRKTRQGGNEEQDDVDDNNVLKEEEEETTGKMRRCCFFTLSGGGFLEMRYALLLECSQIFIFFTCFTVPLRLDQSNVMHFSHIFTFLSREQLEK